MSFLDTIKARLGLKKSFPVGLDISSDGIVLASLSKGKAGYQVQALAMGPTPPNSIQDGEIVDPTAVGEAVKELMEANGIEIDYAVEAV